MSRSNQLPNLDKLFKDEDDQDFVPQGGSNLAAIFGAPQKSGDGFLEHVTQKKSTSKRSTPQRVQQTSSKTVVIIAKVVHVYKLVSGQYTSRGKMGIALTGNIATRVYQIILYERETEHVSVVTLTPEFNYSVDSKGYGCYNDHTGQMWSVCFENESSIEFAREVGVSKFRCRPKKSDSVMYQDLTGQDLTSPSTLAEEGDHVTVKITICTNLSQPLNFKDSPTQTMSVEISEDDNWERFLLASGRGLKRLLILPPSKQISLGPGFPRDKEIIMQVEVININRPEKKDEILPPCSPVSEPSVTSNKASILSRMAKMGQSILPKVSSTSSTDGEETEDEVPVKSSRRFKPGVASPSLATKYQTPVTRESHSDEKVPPTNVLVPRRTEPSASQSSEFTSPWSGNAVEARYITMDRQYYPVHQVPLAQPMSAAMDPNINILMSETRTQNTEIRMGMSKIADNVQKLLDKFHVLEVQNASSPINERAMETSLKMLMALNTAKDRTGNEKNPMYCDGDSGRDDKSKELVTRLEGELKTAKGLLEERAKEIGNLKAEKQQWNSDKKESCERIQGLEKSLADSEISLRKALKDLKTANETANDLRNENARLQSTISVKKQAGNGEAMEIKRIMNKTYRALAETFVDDSYTSKHIKHVVANTIRNITLQVLEELSDDEEPQSDTKADVQMRDKVFREPKMMNVVKTELSTSTESDNNNKSSVSAPNIDSTSSFVGLNVIPVAREEPPPIPPIDADAEGDWLIP